MPFTPFHMDPGILIKALLQGSFSLMVFGWAQIVMDIQPFYPFFDSNELLGFISISQLHRFCFYSAGIGAIIYFLIRYRLQKTES